MTRPRIGSAGWRALPPGDGRGHGGRCPKPGPGFPPPAPPAAPAGRLPTSVSKCRPPPFTDGIFPCSSCHATMPVNRTRRELTELHTDIVLKHDEQHRWCLDCHDADAPGLSCTWRAGARVLRRESTCCAASATARSCATGAPACTGGGRASGTATRRTCCARTATIRTSRGSRPSRPCPRRRGRRGPAGDAARRGAMTSDHAGRGQPPRVRRVRGDGGGGIPAYRLRAEAAARDCRPTA